MRRGLVGVGAVVAALAASVGTASAAEVFSDSWGRGGTPIWAIFGADAGENNNVTASVVADTGVLFDDPHAVLRTRTTGVGIQPCVVVLHDGICHVPWVDATAEYLLGQIEGNRPLSPYVQRIVSCLSRCDQYHLMVTLYGGDTNQPSEIGHGVIVDVGDGANTVRFLPAGARYPLVEVGSRGSTSNTAVLPSSEGSAFYGSTDIGPDRVTLADTIMGGDVRTGAGNDTINVRNGTKDYVSCGAGDDTVIADAIDVVDADCEHVTRG